MSCVEKEIFIKNKSIIQTFKVFGEKLVSSEIRNAFTENKLKSKEEFYIRLAKFSGQNSNQEIQKFPGRKETQSIINENFLRVEAGHRLAKRRKAQTQDFTQLIKNESRIVKASEFNLVNWRKEKGTLQEEKLIFYLSNSRENLEVELTYKLREGPYLYKEIRIKNGGNKNIWILDIDVLEVEIDNFSLDSSPEDGFPEFINEEFFVGVEFPVWTKVIQGKRLTLWHHPGKLLEPADSLVSKRAIIGVSKTGKIKQQFRNYITDISIGRKKVEERPISVYNDWGTHGSEGATEEETLSRINLLREVKENYGIIFDYYIIDDGWAERGDEPWRIKKKNWPLEFKKLAKELNTINAKLGLWMTFRCLAEKEYKKNFKNGVFKLIDKYKLSWIKLDGGVTECDNPGHGHLPEKKYSQEAIFESLIELLCEIRKRNPEIIIQHCWGINESPWWVMHYDMLFCKVESIPHLGIAPIPALHLRNSLDIRLDQAIISQYEEGFIPWTVADDDGVYIIEPMKNWKDNLILSCLGRGNGKFQIYGKIELLKDKDWEFMQKTYNLLGDCYPVFLNTEKIFGSPQKGEVYGYSHFLKDKGFIVLNNPSFKEKQVNLSPWVKNIDIKLAPFKLLLLEISREGKEWKIIECLKEKQIEQVSKKLPIKRDKFSSFKEIPYSKIKGLSPVETKVLKTRIENIKFSTPDKTYTKDIKGWLNAPQNASWWVNPRGRRKEMCYRLNLGKLHYLSKIELENSSFPEKYSISISSNLIQWEKIGIFKGRDREYIKLPSMATQYIKLIPEWNKKEGGDWGIKKIRLFEKDKGSEKEIPSSFWIRNGLYYNQTNIKRVYYTRIKLENSALGKLLCIPLQTMLNERGWHSQKIRGYNVPHNNIFLIVMVEGKQIIFQTTPELHFVSGGSWITFFHRVLPEMVGKRIELFAISGDTPEEVILQGNIYLIK